MDSITSMDFATSEEIKYAHDLLLNGLPDFDDEKRNIILCNSSADIIACPGSGKTTTLLAKLAILAKRMPLADYKGICVLTHTNVAIDEIKSKLASQADVLFNYPNYFGTIQGFVDKFLTIPYFNSVNEVPLAAIDDERAGRLFNKAFYSKEFDELKSIYSNIINRIPKEINDYETKKIFTKIEQKKFLFDSYYSVDTDSYHTSYKEKAIVKDHSTDKFRLLDSTRGFPIKNGVLKYEDAYSFAIAYAKQCNLLREAMSKRFSYVYIDEMQDTNTLQYDLFDLIFDNSKIIVQRFGDPSQSIYNKKKIWNPIASSLPISSSNRFGENIAAVLRTVCEKDNSDLKGNPTINSLKPIILVYDNPEDVLSKFIEIVSTKKIGDETIADLAKKEQRKDSLHRFRIKAVGWSGDNQRGHLSIKTYFPQYTKVSGSAKIDKTSLYQFINRSENETIQVFADSVFTAIAYLLDISGKKFPYNGKDLHYTKTRVQDFLKNEHPTILQDLRLKLSVWGLESLNSDSNFCSSIHNSIISFISTKLSPLFGLDTSSTEYLEFVKIPTETGITNPEDTQLPKYNIFSHNGVDIEVATVHSVKGETHVATLYMETYYKKKYESEYMADQLCGKPYTGDNQNTLEALRVAYVAMSRPRYLLCFAIQKNRFSKLDRTKLSSLWDIVEI